MEKSLADLVRQLEKSDKNGETHHSTYVTQNMRQDIDTTEAYLNSKFTSGSTDSLGRDKPFDNICVFNRNIWYRATDIDSKNLMLRASSNKQQIPAFLCSLKLREWMNSVDFGQFLNDWGLTLAGHGSAIVEFIEKEGKMSCKVQDWNVMLVDPIDFDGNVKVKKLWFTPAQLKKNKSYDKEMVKDLLDNLQSRETIDGQKKDNKANYICVYEVHGELPLSYLTDKEKDEDEYVQQMHVLTFQESKQSGKYDDYTLFSGREKQDPFMITHLLKKDGVTYVGGAVKNLFEAQWMVNHSAKQILDQLDLASKIVFQTSDGSFEGANVLTSIENGDILKHKPNEPLTQLNNKPDIVAMQSNKGDWKASGNQQNGISDAMAGQNPPSGSAWRQTQAILQESHSLFELMTETKGLYIKQMFKTYLLPFFRKQLKNNDEISAYLEAHEIKKIDDLYLPAETTRRVNQRKKDVILSGEIYTPEMEQMDSEQVGQQVSSELTGNQRFIKPEKEDWATEFEDLDWDNLELDITGESVDIQAKMATLDSALKLVLSLGGRPMSEDERFIFNQLMTAAGTVSPLQLSMNQQAQAPVGVQQPVPVNQPQPVPSMAMAGG